MHTDSIYNQSWQNLSMFSVKWEVLREIFDKEEYVCSPPRNHLLRGTLVQKRESPSNGGNDNMNAYITTNSVNTRSTIHAIICLNRTFINFWKQQNISTKEIILPLFYIWLKWLHFVHDISAFYYYHVYRMFLSFLQGETWLIIRTRFPNKLSTT